MRMKKNRWLAYILAGLLLVCFCGGCQAAGTEGSSGESGSTGMESSERESSEMESSEMEGSEMESSEIESSETESSEMERVETESTEVENSEPQEPDSEKEEVSVPSDNTVSTTPSGIASPSNSGALQVIGSKLCDSKGNPVTLRGLSTHGLAWFPDYVNEAAFREFHETWKCNVMRLAMYTHEYNGYCTGGDMEYLKNLIRKGVEYATKNDMYVIVDWHVLNEGNPQTYKGEAIRFFAEMSAELKDHTNVIYEICNEPCHGTSWQDIKSYAEEVIPVIRGNDSDAIIIVGTPNWSQQVEEAVRNPITGYENIMYALHFYAATHTDWLRNNMVAAINAGLPIFVTEYGICDASGNGAIDSFQSEQWITLMNEYGVSHCAWNISNKNETSAIFKPECHKYSGWEEGDLSASGKWLFDMLRKWQN